MVDRVPADLRDHLVGDLVRCAAAAGEHLRQPVLTEQPPATPRLGHAVREGEEKLSGLQHNLGVPHRDLRQQPECRPARPDRLHGAVPAAAQRVRMPAEREHDVQPVRAGLGLAVDDGAEPFEVVRGLQRPVELGQGLPRGPSLSAEGAQGVPRGGGDDRRVHTLAGDVAEHEGPAAVGGRVHVVEVAADRVRVTGGHRPGGQAGAGNDREHRRPQTLTEHLGHVGLLVEELAQPPLGPLGQAHVAQHEHRGGGAAELVDHARRGEFEVDLPVPLPGPQGQLRTRGLQGREIAQDRDDAGHEIGDLPGDQVGAGGAEHAGRSGIRVHDPPVGVEHQHRVGHPVHDHRPRHRHEVEQAQPEEAPDQDHGPAGEEERGRVHPVQGHDLRVVEDVADERQRSSDHHEHGLPAVRLSDPGQPYAQEHHRGDQQHVEVDGVGPEQRSRLRQGRTTPRPARRGAVHVHEVRGTRDGQGRQHRNRLDRQQREGPPGQRPTTSGEPHHEGPQRGGHGHDAQVLQSRPDPRRRHGAGAQFQPVAGRPDAHGQQEQRQRHAARSSPTAPDVAGEPAVTHGSHRRRRTEHHRDRHTPAPTGSTDWNRPPSDHRIGFRGDAREVPGKPFRGVRACRVGPRRNLPVRRIGSRRHGSSRIPAVGGHGRPSVGGVPIG